MYQQVYTRTPGTRPSNIGEARGAKQTEGGSSGRRRLLRLEGGRFRMQIAKAYNQSAGGTIHIQAVSMGKHQRRQTADHGLLRLAGASVRTRRIHAYVHLGGVPYAERTTERVCRERVVYRRGGQNGI